MAGVPYWRLSAFYFAYLAALGGFAPYFAPWLETRGLRPFEIGVVMSLWYATRVFAPPLWGAFAARSPQPVRWLRAGALLTLAAFALFLLPLGFAAIALAMALYASVCNAIMPQFEALTLAHLGARRSAYGRIRVWGSIGFVVANLGFGWLLQRLGYGWLVACMLPLFALLVLAAFANDDPPAAAGEPAAVGLRTLLRERWRERPLQVFLLTALAMQLAHGAFYVYLSLHLDRAGWSAQAIGGFWAIGVIAEIVTFVCLPRWLPRLDARTLMAACFAVGTLRWLVTAWLPQEAWAIGLAQCGHACTFAVFHATCMQAVGQFFPGRAGVHGQALLYGVGSGAGGVLGALYAGGLWELGGGQASFLGAAAVSAAGLWLALRVRVPRLELQGA